MRRKHEKFREIAGNSAPALPEFDIKSQKFRQFGVFTKFLSLSKIANLVTLSSVKRSESYHDQSLILREINFGDVTQHLNLPL